MLYEYALILTIILKTCVCFEERSNYRKCSERKPDRQSA